MELSLPMSSASTIAEPARNSRRVSIRRLVIMRKELFSPRRRKTPGVSSTSARPSGVGKQCEKAFSRGAAENRGKSAAPPRAFLGFELLVFLHFRKNAEFGLH